MGKRDRKKKRQQQRPSEGSGGGGVLTSLRGGFKKVAAGGGKTGPRTPMQRVWDVVFWVVILALLAFFAYRRFR
jgi:hypothetical protein